MAGARSQPPKNHSAPETPRQGRPNAAVPGNRSAQITRKGNRDRQDPYEISSDSEVNELPKPIPTAKVTPKSGVRSARSAERGASTVPKSTQSYVGEPAPQKTIPGTPARQIIGSVARATSGSRRRTPQPIPQGAEIISLIGDGDESRRRTLEQIAEGVKIISVSDSKSQSDDGASEADGDPFAPIQPSNKAIGKRSHHAVNNHVNIVDQRELKSPKDASRPILIRNSRGVVPVFRKKTVPAPSAPEHDSVTDSSSGVGSDGASDIPARLPPTTTPVKAPVSTPTPSQAQAATPRFDSSSPNASSITNGVAHRRITRRMSGSSTTRPNYRIPGIREMAAAQKRAAGGTPSKPAKRSGKASDKADEGPPPGDRTASRMETTNISIELPTMTPEKQAEYAVVSPQGGPTDAPHPLKSFGEINGAASPSVRTPQPHRGAEEDEALDYVLRESPRWLNGVTQVEQQETSTPRSTKRRREKTVSPPPVVGTQESGTVHGGGIMSPERPPPGTAQPLTTPAPQPAGPALTTGHSVSREVQGGKKRKHADTADGVVPTPSQQHRATYNDDETKKIRKAKLSRRQRRRLRKRIESQRDDGSHHGSTLPAPRSTASGKKSRENSHGDITTRAVMTPPATSRPSSPEPTE
ncbi:hypothetical protein DL766_009680 [Monosporascus sp. MC13-8B]|uniref:Uncharacterized protein n=1 Tax=Monosporascus cannonballus TaxID=155416 RepID=A0ABY0GYG5_9PEZI|nr:hypothetical protein DL762_009269 [Monosporascus cannonballus]RYO87588.1 hypothetical protein DL763_006289 [Monosporascus cannonballus]RYP14440.1 hypothetical protein DL766_009680 [Monosporascus sp. MC13-8B]